MRTLQSSTFIYPRAQRAARAISRRVDRMFAAKRPVFAPFYETRSFFVRGDHVNSWENLFDFGKSLLALTAVSLGTTVLALATQVEAYSADGLSPYHLLHLLDTSLTWYNACGLTLPAPLRVAITGWWGVHRDYTHAWQAVDALAAAILTSTATTLTVADVDGVDYYGIAPRISAGSLLRIDDELLEVTATDTGSNIVTVIRGVNGSTADTHVLGAVVEGFAVEDPIRRVVARQAGLLYARAGAFTSVEVSGMGTEVRYPNDLLGELRGVVNEYADEY